MDGTCVEMPDQRPPGETEGDPIVLTFMNEVLRIQQVRQLGGSAAHVHLVLWGAPTRSVRVLSPTAGHVPNSTSGHSAPVSETPQHPNCRPSTQSYIHAAVNHHQRAVKCPSSTPSGHGVCSPGPPGHHQVRPARRAPPGGLAAVERDLEDGQGRAPGQIQGQGPQLRAVRGEVRHVQEGGSQPTPFTWA